MFNLKAEMITFPPQNMMLIDVLYQLLMVIGDPILLGGFKMGDEILDKSLLGSILVGPGADGYFI